MPPTHATHAGYSVTKNRRTRVRKTIHRPGLDPKSPKQLAAATSINKQLAKRAENLLNKGICNLSTINITAT